LQRAHSKQQTLANSKQQDSKHLQRAKSQDSKTTHTAGAAAEDHVVEFNVNRLLGVESQIVNAEQLVAQREVAQRVAGLQRRR
jgi:hypothetical protein